MSEQSSVTLTLQHRHLKILASLALSGFVVSWLFGIAEANLNNWWQAGIFGLTSKISLGILALPSWFIAYRIIYKYLRGKTI